MSAVAIAATPSPRPVKPSPSVVVARDAHRRADQPRESCASSLGAAGGELRAVADDLHGDVADRVSGRLDQASASRAGRPRRAPREPRVGGAEHARRCRRAPPPRAARRRSRGSTASPSLWPDEARLVGPVQAAEPERGAGVVVARARRCRCRCGDARVRSRRVRRQLLGPAQVPRRRDLEGARRRPSTTSTASPAAANSAASSVYSSSRRGVGIDERAAREALRRLHVHESRDRSTVSSTTPRRRPA